MYFRNIAFVAISNDSHVEETLDTSNNSVDLYQEKSDEIQTEISLSALFEASKSRKSRGSWLLDSCCSSHMSGDESLFTSLSSMDSATFVKFGDGKRLKAQGFGQVLTPIGQLEALFVPQMCANLLSVSQLNKSGASISFLPEKSEIHYAGQKFSVSLVGNIFQVDEICYYHSDISDSLSLWHQKLGHLNFPAVISFLKRFGIRVDKFRQNLFC